MKIMVSAWRNDLPIKNLYWQVGGLYLVLVTDDEAVSEADLLAFANQV